MQQLYAIADKGYTELEQVRRSPMYLTTRSYSAKDASTLDTIIQHGETFMPLLREEHAQIMKELEQEQSVAAEIENCDQEYLNELRATLEEQGYCLGLIARYGTAANAGENSAVLDERRAEVAEAKAKLERLEEKVRDIETTNTETTGSIDSLQQTLHVQENSTYTEALRLKGNVLSLSLSRAGPRRCKIPQLTLDSCADELAALEQLHLWQIARVKPDVCELVYASRCHIHVPCTKYKPKKDQIRITKTKEIIFSVKDQFPRFTDLIIDVAQQRLASYPSNLKMKHVRIFFFFLFLLLASARMSSSRVRSGEMRIC